ncbi:MAG: hypothetical protein Q8918_18535 [Bacteroidota bacterium]|nr:hypothetical protein [Bacteroidota bacterium]
MLSQRYLQFTNLIKAGGQLHEFNFRRSMGTEGPLFTVDVADARGDRHYIIFRYEGDQWVLKSRTLPPWIEEVIPKIQELIGTQIG